MKTPDHSSLLSAARISRANLLAGAAFVALASIVSPVAASEESTIPKASSLDTLFAARTWLNGTPTRDALRGKVVLIDVFTFDCYNCQNITPNLRTLSRSKRDGLEIVGIHSPETTFERDHSEVVKHLGALGVTWPDGRDGDHVARHTAPGGPSADCR